MKRVEWLQETRKMRFEEAYGGWHGGRLTQEECFDSAWSDYPAIGWRISVIHCYW